MNQYNSIYAAIVVDNKDPKFLGRVKLLVPAISDKFTTEWAMPAVHTCGVNSGQFDPPPNDSGCFVVFMEGDPEVPIYLGGFWAEPDGNTETPEAFRREDVSNRGLRTPLGHLIEYDDATDTQGIRITSIGGFKFHIDDKNKKIFLQTPAGSQFVLDDDNELILLQTTGDFTATIGKNLNINVTENANIMATGQAKFVGDGGTEVGSESSTTMVKGMTVLLAGGGAPVAVVGGKCIGTGNFGAPVVSTIIQGSSKVFAPM
ncbi:hypothetical protein MASR1M48_17520 [Lactococcus petauri]